MMGKLLGALVLAVCACGPPACAAAEACHPPALTEQDAMTWAGTPLNQLSNQGKGLVRAAVLAQRLGAEQERMAALYPLSGKDGKAAVKALEAGGFRCEFEVAAGAMPGKSGLTLEPGSLPVYRCSKVDPGSCDCPHPQIAFSAGVQAPGRSAQEYRALVDSAKLKPGTPSYTCLLE
jgi:hypothetical protein